MNPHQESTLATAINEPPVTSVTDTTGRTYKLTSVAGYGGQGIVCRESSGDYMVKLIWGTCETNRRELRRRYEALFAARDHIPPKARLVLPNAILQDPHLGYVMRRVKAHEPLTTLLIPPRDNTSGQEADSDTLFSSWYNKTTGGLRRRLSIGVLLARSFHDLHRTGYAYCDLSDSNVLVASDPRRQSICLIDADNLSVPQEADALVLGTPLYMAPEVLQGSHQPDALTDCHSLATLLFQMLRFDHPFFGDDVRNGTPDEEENALRGEKPFVEHPDDPTNRSTRLLSGNLTLTSTLGTLFQRAFVDGLHHRTRRPSPLDWEDALMRALYATLSCRVCGASFYAPSPVPTDGVVPCPWCAAAVACPHLLTFFDLVRQDGRDVTRRVGTMMVSTGVTRRIPARQAQYGMRGEEGDAAVAHLETVAPNGSSVLRNVGDNHLFIARSGDTRMVQINPGGSAPFGPEHVLYFSDPRDSIQRSEENSPITAVRCARLRNSPAEEFLKETASVEGR